MKVVTLLFFYFLVDFVQAKVTVRAEYSPTANIFSTLDQVSNWWPGFTEAEYQSYWEKRFGLNQEDRILFKKYESLRFKYTNDPDQNEKDPLKNRNGFFAMLGSIDSDPLAKAFYSSKSMDEALQKASRFLDAEDFQFLRDFYKHFEPNYSLLVKESIPFVETAKKLNKLISTAAISQYYDKVLRYFRAEGGINYQVLYVWWPPLKRTLSTPSGQYLLMYYNPELHKHNIDQDVVFHEIVHVISMRQPLPQKQKFTKIFLDNCQVGAKIKKQVILEEPLAVAIGQILFMEKFFPATFNQSDSLYRNSWVSTLGRLITPLVREDFRRNRDLGEGTILSMAKFCSDLIAAIKIVQ